MARSNDGLDRRRHRVVSMGNLRNGKRGGHLRWLPGGLSRSSRFSAASAWEVQVCLALEVDAPEPTDIREQFPVDLLPSDRTLSPDEE